MCSLRKVRGRDVHDGRVSLDPGGYFIVNGSEKVILVQEQLSKNRIIVEADVKKDSITASVTSSTHARKSKTYVALKKDLLYMRHNILNEDIPICVLLKAMGVTSDMEMMSIVAGPDQTLQDDFAINFEETIKLGIHTQQQALDYLGGRIKIARKSTPYGQARRNYVQEALEAVSSILLAHVPIENLNFRPKALYVAHMARRVLMAKQNPSLVDDRDYVGNKRLELAGQLLSLLFEDLFKKYNFDVKINMDKVLRKPNKTEVADPCTIMMGHAKPHHPRHESCNCHRELESQAFQNGPSRGEPSAQSTKLHRNTGYDDQDIQSVREDP